MEPVMSVQQKLEQARMAADEARNAPREEEKAQAPTPPEPVKPAKRKAIPKRVKSKRRSTLSPAELEDLMGMKT